jgi:hypothetical protein
VAECVKPDVPLDVPDVVEGSGEYGPGDGISVTSDGSTAAIFEYWLRS